VERVDGARRSPPPHAVGAADRVDHDSVERPALGDDTPRDGIAEDTLERRRASVAQIDDPVPYEVGVFRVRDIDVVGRFIQL